MLVASTPALAEPSSSLQIRLTVVDSCSDDTGGARCTAPHQRSDTPSCHPRCASCTTGDGRERNTRRDPHLLMRALLILLALLAQPAAALEVLPTTLQLPAEGRAELWLTQSRARPLAGPRRCWPGISSWTPNDCSPATRSGSARRGWISPRAVRSASGCCHAIRPRQWVNRPTGSC